MPFEFIDFEDEVSYFVFLLYLGKQTQMIKKVLAVCSEAEKEIIQFKYKFHSDFILLHFWRDSASPLPNKLDQSQKCEVLQKVHFSVLNRFLPFMFEIFTRANWKTLDKFVS